MDTTDRFVDKYNKINSSDPYIFTSPEDLHFIMDRIREEQVAMTISRGAARDIFIRQDDLKECVYKASWRVSNRWDILTMIIENADFLSKFLADQEPLGEEFAKVLHDNLFDLYVESSKMENFVNYEAIIGGLINGIKSHFNTEAKLNEYNRCKHVFPTYLLVNDFHTVGIKSTRQTGLTSFIKTQIAKGTKACVLTANPIFYKDLDNLNVIDVFNVDFYDYVRSSDFTTFYIEQEIYSADYKDAVFKSLYEKVGKDLIIIELY